MQTNQTIQTASTTKPTTDIEVLDKKVTEMTEQFQAVLDETVKSFEGRFAIAEDTLRAQSEELTALKNGVVLRVSPLTAAKTEERVAKAKTANDARSALYDAVDEDVKARGLSGSARKIVHIERRKLIAGAAGVAVVSSAATLGTVALINKRRAARAAKAEAADSAAVLGI